MSVFQVYQNDVHRNGNRLFVIVETDDVDMMSLLTRLQVGPIIVDRLRTVPTSEPALMEITSREDMVLTMSAVYTVETPRKRYVEYVAQSRIAAPMGDVAPMEEQS